MKNFLLFFSLLLGVASCSASEDEPPAPAALDAVDTGDVDYADPPDEDDGPSGPTDISFVPDGVDPPPAKPAPNAPTDWVGIAVAKPNQFFKRQVRHPIWNPTGPLTSGNCAPASLAMIAKAFGKEPAGLTIEQSIDRVRVMMNKPSDSGGASLSQVRLGVTKLGLHYRAMPEGDLDVELAKKRMVVLTGYPGLDGTSTASAYQAAFRSAGYDYTFDANHSIAVFGKTASGRYVVGDPLSKIGAITLTATQMRDFWKRWGGEGTSIWR
jgi:hypothetical protein